jgi:hypothetical protein
MRVPFLRGLEKGQDDSLQRLCTVGKAIPSESVSNVSHAAGGIPRDRCVL